MLTCSKRMGAHLFHGVFIVCCLLLARPAEAANIFNVSATFADNNSTPLTGTIAIDSITDDIIDFSFNIPAMTNGTTNLAGALFTPATANLSFGSIGASTLAVEFQLKGTQQQGADTLYLLVPTPPSPYPGGPVLREVVFEGQAFHSGYQSGPPSTPFFLLKADGIVTPAAVPEPASYLCVGFGMVALYLKRRGGVGSVHRIH